MSTYEQDREDSAVGPDGLVCPRCEETVYRGECGCHPNGSLRHGANRRGYRWPEYTTWASMIRRCYNPNNPRFSSYGGCGIKVCDRWRTSFQTFLLDMGRRPKGTSLDRFPDKHGNYEPENCRWATPLEQQNNMRNNVLITWDEKTLSVYQWARQLGMRPHTLTCRLLRGWPVERAFKEKVHVKRS